MTMLGVLLGSLATLMRLWTLEPPTQPQPSLGAVPPLRLLGVPEPQALAPPQRRAHCPAPRARPEPHDPPRLLHRVPGPPGAPYPGRSVTGPVLPSNPLRQRARAGTARDFIIRPLAGRAFSSGAARCARAAPEGPYCRVSAHHSAEQGYHTTDPSLWGSLRQASPS